MPVILAYALGVVILFVMARLLLLPIKWFWRFAINIIAGGLALLVINFFGNYIGIHIGMNFLTAFITGVLGIPGVILILIVQYLFL